MGTEYLSQVEAGKLAIVMEKQEADSWGNRVHAEKLSWGGGSTHVHMSPEGTCSPILVC